ncbi:ABC transporter permease [Noviherbaspirillum soli]|uniref:ABC transporter permease n=1 Tax=Noviherbaspirillum soli TaxID=1064518 RepID=UPI00188C9433|nr:ABC transporter permease [Noviherbaspirillum soli]
MNPYQNIGTSPHSMFLSFWRNKGLILALIRREVLGRYRGSIMGMAWSFFNPLFMLFIYTFVFSVVFKSRWGGTVEETKGNFTVILFAGLFVHGLFAECVNRAPSLILSNVNYVKKVVFPLEILPIVAFGSALFHSLISLFVLLAAQLLIMKSIPWTAIFFPLVMLPLVFATLGIAWFLAALGVYLRDVGQVTGIFTTALLFLSPVFYPISALPPQYQTWLKINPLTIIIEEGRNTLIFGKVVNFDHLGVLLAASVVLAYLGYAWFQKTRKGFSDVI